MKAFPFALLLLLPVAAHAASPEEAYLAARDRDIAAIKTLQDADKTKAADARLEKDLADLQTKMKPIVGRVAVAGFPSEGKINLEALFARDEEYGMLDGLVFGTVDGGMQLIVTTDGLLDAWLVAHAKKDPTDPDIPRDPAAAVKTEIFYTWAVNTDAAAVHYAELPLAVPPGTKFAQAMLSARTQDNSPPAPDRVFVAMERAGRVFVVEEKLAMPMKKIAACDAVTRRYNAQADAADKAYAAHPPTDPNAPDPGVALRDKGEVAFRACYGEKAKGSAGFKAATEQATKIVAAIMAARVQ